MALNASNRLRPRVIALQKRGLALLIERTKTAFANGTVQSEPLEPVYRCEIRVRSRRTANPAKT